MIGEICFSRLVDHGNVGEELAVFTANRECWGTVTLASLIDSSSGLSRETTGD
jgi:hypothetical protein